MLAAFRDVNDIICSEFVPTGTIFLPQVYAGNLQNLMAHIRRSWRACSRLSSIMAMPGLTREREGLEKFTALSWKTKTRHGPTSSPYLPENEGNYGGHNFLSGDEVKTIVKMCFHQEDTQFRCDGLLELREYWWNFVD
jgi:hypothetical protein